MQLYCASCAVLRISWYYPRLHPSSPRLLHSFCSTRHRLYTANNIRCIVPLSGTHFSEAQSSYSVYRRISASDGDHIWLHACFAPIDTAGRANSPGPAFFFHGVCSVVPMCVAFRVHKAAIFVNDMSNLHGTTHIEGAPPRWHMLALEGLVISAHVLPALNLRVK